MLLSWFWRPVGQQAKPSRREHRPRPFCPRLEELEDRCLLSTVMNLNDSGDGSLRQAILSTAAGGTVDFQTGLTGTIALTTGELAITNDLTIAGPGADTITVSGSDASRVFNIAANHTVAISGLTIADGRSPNDRGGGIHNLLSTLTVTDCILSGNSVTSSGSAVGGGIENEAGSLTVIDCTLSGNSVTGGNGVIVGGGIASYGTLTVVDSTFSGNSANGSLSGGGAISTSGSASVTGSTLSGNSASAGGAILNNNVGPLTMLNCTLSGNSAVLNGSGSGLGGAIYTEGGGLTLTSCTLSANSADRLAGGIVMSNGHETTLGNTIIAGNSAPVGFSPDVVVFSSAPINSNGYNLIGNGGSASGFTATDLIGTAANPIDPQLGPLQDNGGPTQTMAPLAGSPALDAGDPAQLGAADQRGVTRAGGVNIGAYQASASAFVLTASATVTAGTPFDVTVQAVDIFGQAAFGYRGTVTFTASDTDPAVVLPADYPFTAADQGTHTFGGAFILVTPGDQTLTVTDLAGGFSAGLTLTVQS
jgi:hypothetical protein